MRGKTTKKRALSPLFPLKSHLRYEKWLKISLKLNVVLHQFIFQSLRVVKSVFMLKITPRTTPLRPPTVPLIYGLGPLPGGSPALGQHPLPTAGWHRTCWLLISWSSLSENPFRSSPGLVSPQRSCSKCTDTFTLNSQSSLPVVPCSWLQVFACMFLTYLMEPVCLLSWSLHSCFSLSHTQREMIRPLNLHEDWTCFLLTGSSGITEVWREGGFLSRISSQRMSTQVPERLRKVISSIHLGTALLPPAPPHV